MALTLRTKASQATFSIADGAMKAEWTLTSDMSEEQLVDALVGMLRYIKREQPYQPERHLHAVADHVEEQLPDVVHVHRTLDQVKQDRPAVMTWAPAVQPRPLADSLEAAGQNGFELIPPEELD